MKTRITSIALAILVLSGFLYSQSSTALLQTATWHSEAGLTDTTNDIGAAYYIKESGNPSIQDTGFIYMVGEVGNFQYTSSISNYNTVTRTWSAPDSLPILPMYYKAVQLGGKIYMAGGKDGQLTCICNVPDLRIYDIEKDSLWSGEPMLKELQSYAIGTFGDSLIYIMGGDRALEGSQNIVQIYNTNTETWTYGTPFPEPKRSGMGGAIAGNIIVLAGGSSHEEGMLSTVNIGVINPSDPYNITWTTSEYPGGKLSNIISGAWYGKENKYIYFVGGHDSTYKYQKSLWAYNLQTNEWSKGPDKITPSRCYSDFIPVIRNDSVFMVTIGHPDSSSLITNEWLYIGNDVLDPDIATNDEPNYPTPQAYSLSQNYPNPFNPSTKIKYSLRDPVYVKLTIYDMLGREIKTLINEFKSAGEHEVVFNAAELNLSSGVYIYRIKAGSFVQTKKLMLLK